ncbi:hypothetical protein JBE04_08360 [Streptomyces sp. PRKS01-29]|nr:hypothetical protein [Streptomyces sabulosicollis]MBI0294494.1 hypothetical protein [Streptomyces sabulosicollis]
MAKAPDAAAEFVVDFPTLWVVPDWIEAHCPIPDGFRQGEPMELYPWQLWCTVNHYRVKPGATRMPDGRPRGVTAFHYRRSQIVAPQKTGKGPWSATVVLAEARGPVLFAGWAKGGERYRCSDWGCDCGWWYAYEPGEPMGEPWPTPLIQLLATSEDQVANIYRPLREMVKRGPLGELMKVGEEFTRVGESGLIEVVTSSAQSRLGNPINFVMQDETGLYTKTNKLIRVADTQLRGVTAMNGRAMETTNAWDPSEASTAQVTAGLKTGDIFRYHPQAPKALSYKEKRQRRKIHAFVYAGSDHVDLDAIEGLAMELIEKGELAQAERFFGNRITSGSSTWMDGAKWEARAKPREVKPGTRVVGGFDGSDIDDHTAIRLETLEGYQFTPVYGPDKLPTIWDPADYGGQVPRLEVQAAMEEVMETYDVVRLYADPPYWKSEVDGWAEKYGEKVVIRWYTNRVVQMHAACEGLLTDVTKKDSTFTHDGCSITAEHVENARAAARPGKRYVLTKASQAQKIDACVTSVLAHEALSDIKRLGLAVRKKNYVYTA